MSVETPAYVGICKTCSGLNAAMVDDGRDPKGVARFLKEIASDGHAIERKTVGFVRTASSQWCECHKRKTQPSEQRQDSKENG